MNSSLKYTLLDSQFGQNPILLHKNERKPIFQSRKINNTKNLLALKNEQILELFLPPFQQNVDLQSDELNEMVELECVCGHCQNSFNYTDNNNDFEDASTKANLDQNLNMHYKNNLNQNDQASQKIKLSQDRIRLQTIQMKSLHKLGDYNGLANLLRVDIRSGLSNYNQSDLAHRVKLYGANRIIIGKHVSFTNIMRENFLKTKTLLILIFGLFHFTLRSYILYRQVGSFVGILGLDEIYIEIGTIFMIFANYASKCLKRWFIDKEFNNLVCVNTEYKVKFNILNPHNWLLVNLIIYFLLFTITGYIYLN